MATKAPAKKAAKPAAKKAPAKKAAAPKAAKPAAKKAPAKKAAPKAAKPAAKKAPAKKAAAPAAKPTSAVKARYNKSQIVQEIADFTAVARKEVGKVLEHLEDIIARHISPKGPGEFVLPGILKINAIKKPAKKARKGINPFTGEEVTFKAKPASTAVKVRPLKKLKEMAAK